MKKFKTTNGYDVLVSKGDYQKVIQFKWYAKPTTRYVYRRSGGKNVLLHRFLLNPGPDQVVDHADRNPLNNTRGNIRLTDHTHNRANSKKKEPKTGKPLSRYKGVTYKKGRKRKPWQVYVCKNGKPKYVGTFRSELAAARAYDRWALKLFGEHALTNKMLYGI